MHHGPKRHIAHLLEKMVSCLTMGGGGDNDTVSFWTTMDMWLPSLPKGGTNPRGRVLESETSRPPRTVHEHAPHMWDGQLHIEGQLPVPSDV